MVISYAPPEPDVVTKNRTEKFFKLFQAAIEDGYLPRADDFIHKWKDPKDFSAASKASLVKKLLPLIEQGIAIDAEIDVEHRLLGTPLQLVSAYGLTELAISLIDKGANVHPVTDYHDGALYRACSHGHLEIVKALIKAGAKINPLKEGETGPLHMACFHGHTEVAKTLIEEGALVNTPHSEGNTALFFALKYPAIMKLLIDAGANVNAQNGGNEKPLNIAVKIDNIEAVKLLLENKATVNHKNLKEETVLHAVAKPHYSLVVHNPEIARLLIEAGAKIDARDNEGCTALHRAAEYCHAPLIDVFFRQGADINARDNRGETPLYKMEMKQTGMEREEVKAFRQEHLVATRDMLLGRGANVNSILNTSTTVFIHYMAEEHLTQCRNLYRRFHDEGLAPKTYKDVYDLLCVWPLLAPKEPIRQEQHLLQLFNYAKWNKKEQAATVLGGLRESGMSAELCDMLQDIVEQRYPSERLSRTAELGKVGI